MAQLKMYLLPGTPIPDDPLPEGYSVSNYRTEADKLAWVACCRHGLVGDDADEKTFDDSILVRDGLVPERDLFFLDYGGEHVGTVAAYKKADTGCGNIHMVAIREDFRGRGLARYLNQIAARHMAEMDVPYSFLTTDEWRKGAVKSYLSAGLLPVEYDEGMEARWKAVLEEYGIDRVDMLREDASFYKTIYRTSHSEATCGS